MSDYMHNVRTEYENDAPVFRASDVIWILGQKRVCSGFVKEFGDNSELYPRMKGRGAPKGFTEAGLTRYLDYISEHGLTCDEENAEDIRKYLTRMKEDREDKTHDDECLAYELPEKESEKPVTERIETEKDEALKIMAERLQVVDALVKTQALELELLRTKVKAAEAETVYLKQSYGVPTPPKVPTPQMTIRSKVRAHVNAFARKKLMEVLGDQQPDGVVVSSYTGDLWRFLYTQFKYRTGRDYVTRCNHLVDKGEDPPKNKLDLVEDDGMIHEFYAVVKELLPVKSYI